MIPDRRRFSKTQITEVRPLTEADLAYLRMPAARQSLKNIKDSHHNVARLLASGLKNWEVAQRTGYALNRISILAADPAMTELTAKYRGMVTEDWRESVDEFQTLASSNMAKAERMIADKLDDADAKGETLPMRELIAVTSDRMDRFGYGKKNMNVNLNVDFAANLEKARQRIKKVANG